MKQTRESSRMLIEVEYDDLTGKFKLRRQVVDSFSPAIEHGDCHAKELVIDDEHELDTRNEIMRKIDKAMDYLELGEYKCFNI